MFPDRADARTVQITDGRYGRLASIRGDQYMGKALARYGEYSESEVQLWRQLLPPDAICADIGANIGAHTVALASLVPEGWVYAFEPLPFTYRILNANVALNGLMRVEPVNAAVGDTNGQIMVPPLDYTQENNFGGFPLLTVKQGHKVALLKLDDLITKVNFIKADVEGMELHVLKGAANLIQSCRPVLYVENNPGPGQQELIDHIHGLGYDLWWHYAPHYNPENWNRQPPQDDTYLHTVSHNMLGLPAEGANQVDGLEPIAKGAP